ncbi:MAG: UvrB/UvrC motif-containing protein [Planctomyces sp.]
MKKCRRCSKPATLHITEVRDGKASAVHLCETCARDYLETPENSSVSDPASELAAKLDELVREGSEEIMAGLVCPVCGISFAEFRENGRFGCPADYTEFQSEILPLLENIHEDTRHTGKRPVSGSAAAETQSRMILLRRQQQEAIEKEDYETAARLRDEIQAIEEEMRSQGAAPEAKPAAKRGRPKSGPKSE